MTRILLRRLLLKSRKCPNQNSHDSKASERSGMELEVWTFEEDVERVAFPPGRNSHGTMNVIASTSTTCTWSSPRIDFPRGVHSCCVGISESYILFRRCCGHSCPQHKDLHKHFLFRETYRSTSRPIYDLPWLPLSENGGSTDMRT